MSSNTSPKIVRQLIFGPVVEGAVQFVALLFGNTDLFTVHGFVVRNMSIYT